jgi:hypothetical protein
MLVEEIDHDRALDLHVRKISQILPVHRRSSTDIDTRGVKGLVSREMVAE